MLSDLRLTAGDGFGVLRAAKETDPDLPVQAPVKYLLVINIGAARALGLAPPSSLLAIADEVIE